MPRPLVRDDGHFISRKDRATLLGAKLKMGCGCLFSIALLVVVFIIGSKFVSCASDFAKETPLEQRKLTAWEKLLVPGKEEFSLLPSLEEQVWKKWKYKSDFPDSRWQKMRSAKLHWLVTFKGRHYYDKQRRNPSESWTRRITVDPRKKGENMVMCIYRSSNLDEDFLYVVYRGRLEEVSYGVFRGTYEHYFTKKDGFITGPDDLCGEFTIRLDNILGD